MAELLACVCREFVTSLDAAFAAELREQIDATADNVRKFDAVELASCVNRESLCVCSALQS